MRQISLAVYRDLVAGARVIEQDAYGEKVLVLANGTYVKIFRNKRLISTAAFRPYALRFSNNARKLTSLGVPTMEVLSLSYCRENKRHLVFYQPIHGETLRSALRQSSEPALLLERFAVFLADMHRRGIYFRSVHFGNVIVQPMSENFGLIDIADLRIRPWSIGVLGRVRNFRHFLRYREDVDFLETFGRSRFVANYLEASALTGWRLRLFCHFLKGLWPE